MSIKVIYIFYACEHREHYLFTHRSGMPPYEQLKDTLAVGDLLAIKHGTRHIMMYIGTLRDFGFTSQEAPELAEYLDHPLVIHCGPHPDYGERIQQFIDTHPEDYGRCRTTDGGVCVSILGVPVDAAHCHVQTQGNDFHYFPLDEKRYKLTVMDMSDVTSYCWYRMSPDA